MLELEGNPVAAPTASTASRALEGARDMAPMVVGILPFGLALGATISSSHVSTEAGLASAPLILAGAAQLATLQMLSDGTGAAVTVVSALLINLRILLYSASLAPWFRGAPLRTRLFLAGAVIDQTHFVCQPRFAEGDLDQRDRVAYYIGASGLLIAVWLGSQTAAVVIGAQLPAAARLDMAAPLALVGLLAKSVTSRPALAAALTGTAVAALAVGLPFHSATLVATVVGIAVGVCASGRRVAETSS